VVPGDRGRPYRSGRYRDVASRPGQGNDAQISDGRTRDQTEPASGCVDCGNTQTIVHHYADAEACLRSGSALGSGRLDPLLNVVRALARAELDDAKVGEAVHVKRVFLDDGFDFPPALAHGEDDAAIARDLSARNEEIA